MAQPPPPAYDPIPSDRKLYDGIANTAHQTGGREKVQSFTIPIRSAKAWEVKAGQVCRILTPEGPQVGDFNVWNKHNPRERFWAARTRQLQQSHVKVYDRLWSCLPYLRPMITVTAVFGLPSPSTKRSHAQTGNRTRCLPTALTGWAAASTICSGRGATRT